MGVQINGSEGNVIATKGTFSGDVGIGGTLTYEDVTNIDSVGLVTARSGIEIGARPGVAASISVDGNAIFSGITTVGSHMAVGGVTPEIFGGGHVTLEVAGSTTSQGGVFKTATSDSAGTGSSGTEMILFTSNTQGAINVISSDPLTFSTANTERARIDSGGRLLVGNTASSMNAAADNLIVGSGVGHNGITVYSAADGDGWLIFNDGDNANLTGTINYNHASNYMAFRTSTTERLRITSTGDLSLRSTTQNAFLGLTANSTAINFTLGSTSGTSPRMYMYGTGNGQSSAGDIFMGAGTGGILHFRSAESIKFEVNSDNSTAESLSISSAGYVTKPLQPSFLVFPANNGETANGDVTFTNVSHNVGSHYNTSNGRFTAPVAGYYSFFANYVGDAGCTACQVRFKKNGSVTNIGNHYSGGSGTAWNTNPYMSCDLSGTHTYLAANDYVQLNLTGSGASQGQAAYMRFFGYLVH